MSERTFLRLLAGLLTFIALLLLIALIAKPRQEVVERLVPATPPTTSTEPPPAGEFNPVAIYQRAAPAVVTVVPAERGQAAGQGSGFLLSGGLIATNAHVVIDQQTGRRYREFYLQWQSGQRSAAEPISVDLDTDLALLRTTPPEEVSPLQLAPSKQQVVPGQPVAALGSPFGEPQSLSTGTVSAVGRSVRSLSRFQISGALQTDAAINPGNSGGPLLNAQVEVIGINQQIRSSSGANSGVGYAVPVVELQRLVSFARRGKKPQSAYLGVSTQEVWPQLAKKLNIPANSLLVSAVSANGPGARAKLVAGKRRSYFQGSLVLWGGDVLLALDGQRLSSSQRLAQLLRAKQPGDRVALRLWRDKRQQTVPVTLGRRP